MRWIILFLLVKSSLGFSQVSVDSISYEKDLIIYRQALEESHPSLYRFTPKERFDSLFDSIQYSLNDSTSALDFFRSIAQISSLVREGHSYVQPPESLSSSVKSKNLFPFRVLVEDDQVIVLDSRSSALNYLKEATIHAINGQSINDILKVLVASTSTVSAFNHSGIKSRLSLYNNFALAYYYFVDSTGVFQIDYTAKSEDSTTSETVKGSSNLLTKWTYPELPPEPKPPFHLAIDEQMSTATMTISTFAYWVAGQKIKDYERFFESSFHSLRDKGIDHLIIDVRGNRGGEEMIAGELLTYLIDYEFEIYQYCQAKTLDFSFTNSLPNSQAINLSNSNYHATDSGNVMKKARFLESYIPKKRNRFEGEVFVISDGVCASACNIFLAMVKTHGVGEIVGQESGGAFEDVDGRLRVSFNLPYSGIFVSYPAWRMKLNTKGGDQYRGVIPDYQMKPIAESLITGADDEMTFVLEKIGRSIE